MAILPETLLSTDEAARFLGVSTSFLAKRRWGGGGPLFVKIGRRVMYRRTDLDAWINDNTRRSTSEVRSW